MIPLKNYKIWLAFSYNFKSALTEDNGDIKTPEQAMNFAYIQGTIDDFLHITHDGVHFAIQTLDGLQKGGGAE